MKIKAKLYLGTGLLFAMIVVLTIISSFFIRKLAADSKNILVANYNTLDYSRKMQIALNDGISLGDQRRLFEENLKLQRDNVTELGERELTNSLSSHYHQLLLKPADSVITHLVRRDISDIMLLNMQAIERKSRLAGNTADRSLLWIGIIGATCFIIAFTTFANLPGMIANPIRELTLGIREIADQNYAERVHLDKHDEFGELASSFNSMAEKLQEYQAGSMQKLLIEKKRIETLINNMHDPVIGIDEKEQVLFMNDAALKITGLDAMNSIGQPVQVIAASNDLLRLLLQDLHNPVQPAETVVPPLVIYANGKESYFEKEVMPIRIVPAGETMEKLIGTVIMLQNITPFKELDFAKTNFIATVSHELKTPISSIKLSLQLLENEKIGILNTEQQELLGSIKDDAGRLLKITAELLNMAQVETGNIQLSVLPANAAEMFMYAVDATRAQAAGKQINLRFNFDEHIPLVYADSEKTSWVLTNLLSNAIQYSYENASILLSIGRSGDQVEFIVKDSGQGIAPQFKDRIFDRYFRVPGTRKSGTGLGLAISKEFIEAQNGSITVESEFGAGSSFTVSLHAVI